MEMQFSFVASRVLAAGVQLDVFSLIAAGHETATGIAQAAGASERGMGRLLDALTALELLGKTNGRYRLSPLAERFLVRGTPGYFGAMLEHDRLWEAWGALPAVIRSGMPHGRVEQQEKAEEFFPILVRSLHVLHGELARRTAELLGAGTRHRGLRVVDVACGSGIWGIAMAEADREARITAQDFPALLEVTREYLRRHGVEAQFEFLPGDLKQVDFGANRFDVALLGNIVHSEGERSSRDLFKRLHRALGPQGRIVIIDMIPNEDRSGPPFPVFFALNMLVNTLEGDTYTLGEYTRWLTEAGFTKVETADVGSHSPIIIGTKR
ncbi:O-methyltransferase family 2 [mine drainage metagenome]|uniref:O-methyltransferase family 2 n=2 Tax=mine drainage metagenome TaxID=410659 RepID=T0ZV06_9ZZZZ